LTTSRSDKVIITCAVTGGIHTPTMSDALPFTPRDIAAQSIAAAEAGASILHLHARDPKDPPDARSGGVHAIPSAHQAIDRRCDQRDHRWRSQHDGRAEAGRAARRQAGNVLAQHGLDELRHLRPCGPPPAPGARPCEATGADDVCCLATSARRRSPRGARISGATFA
jgi:hypothetical protein